MCLQAQFLIPSKRETCARSLAYSIYTGDYIRRVLRRASSSTHRNRTQENPLGTSCNVFQNISKLYYYLLFSILIYIYIDIYILYVTYEQFYTVLSRNPWVIADPLTLVISQMVTIFFLFVSSAFPLFLLKNFYGAFNS